jgi:hypothetical protein
VPVAETSGPGPVRSTAIVLTPVPFKSSIDDGVGAVGGIQAG